MGKMKLVVVGLVLGLVPISWAQDPRQDAVWDAIDEAMIQYVDQNFHDGDLPRAIQGLRFRYAMHPDDWEAMSDLGWLLESTDSQDEALGLYMKYRRDYPDRRDACYSVAQFWFLKKSYAKIPALVEPELKKTPHPNMYRWLAHSYDRLGRYRDSVRVWDALIALLPGDLPAKSNRNRVLAKIKK